MLLVFMLNYRYNLQLKLDIYSLYRYEKSYSFTSSTHVCIT